MACAILLEPEYSMYVEREKGWSDVEDVTVVETCETMDSTWHEDIPSPAPILIPLLTATLCTLHQFTEALITIYTYFHM